MAFFFLRCFSAQFTLHVVVGFFPQQVDFRDFPYGPVAKSVLSNTVDVSLIPGWETKIPLTTGQLSQHTTLERSSLHCDKDAAQPK